jgi:hypothetical protein
MMCMCAACLTCVTDCRQGVMQACDYFSGWDELVHCCKMAR